MEYHSGTTDRKSNLKSTWKRFEIASFITLKKMYDTNFYNKVRERSLTISVLNLHQFTASKANIWLMLNFCRNCGDPLLTEGKWTEWTLRLIEKSVYVCASICRPAVFTRVRWNTAMTHKLSLFLINQRFIHNQTWSKLITICEFRSEEIADGAASLAA